MPLAASPLASSSETTSMSRYDNDQPASVTYPVRSPNRRAASRVVAPSMSEGYKPSRSRSTRRTSRDTAPIQGRELRAQGRKTMGRLLDGGMRVFAERGVHAARVDDIVRAAKTSHGTFYLYFPNKEALLRALAVECAQEMDELSTTLGAVTADEAGYAEL